ncbi:MAG: Cof-type HAD-IIB family hydrolase [Oscillospiraceae bacterium]|nr:Cof-type HAD-IIB family hydrolase [Oscillospiraceae bacterium]
MKYKLIAADMDGTLLNDESKLTERTKSAIKETVKKGVVFVTSTGRPMIASESVNELFSEDMPFIVFNGVTAIMGKSKKNLFSASLDLECALQIYETGKSRDIPVIMWTLDEELWVSRDCAETQDYRNISGAKLNIIDEPEKRGKSGIAKMMWINEPEKIKIYRGEMAKFFEGRVNCYASRPNFLEFVGAASSKGAALSEIGKIYGIGKSEMIAVGDSDNDISMLEYAGLGVAMQNASREVKFLCRQVTSSNNKDGVAKVIEKYIFNEGNDKK